MAPAKCKTPASSKITKDVIDAVVADSTKKKDEDARKAAAEKITEGLRGIDSPVPSGRLECSFMCVAATERCSWAYRRTAQRQPDRCEAPRMGDAPRPQARRRPAARPLLPAPAGRMASEISFSDCT